MMVLTVGRPVKEEVDFGRYNGEEKFEPDGKVSRIDSCFYCFAGCFVGYLSLFEDVGDFTGGVIGSG